jgi:hypothetical protein
VKRYLILGGILAGLVILLLCWRGSRQRTLTDANTGSEASARTEATSRKPLRENGTRRAESIPLANAEEDYQRLLRERPESAQAFKEDPDLPVAFYGLVVDQDSNVLQNVKVDVEIMQWNLSDLPRTALKATRVEKQSDADGRFEVSGLQAHGVIIRSFTKVGYEPEMVRDRYGEYAAQAGSFDQPKMFRLWSTNLHESLISGEKKFHLVPDGRRYGIDLIKGTIIEGGEGDLVVWIKRSEPVQEERRYDWSCEFAVPAGGLVEDGNYFMFRAPEAGYTSAFAHEAKVGAYGWGVSTSDKRFYLKLRNGQMFGRIVINVDTRDPATIRLSYAVNPSGSRVLR